ncbi:MAG: hypothetical protein RIB60_04260 [Phycisphaerales bacterium]
MPTPIATTSQTNPLIQTRPFTVGRPLATGAAGGAARPSDVANLSGIGRELGELSTILGRLRAAGVESASKTVGYQTRLDDVRDELRSLGEGRALGGQSVKVVTPEVVRAEFYDINLSPDETVEVNVDIIQAAEQGRLYFRLPTGKVEDTDDGDVRISLFGPDGAKRLSFTSGQTLQQVMSTINAFSDRTGLVAEDIGLQSGFTLRSADFGGQKFAAVEGFEGTSNIEIGEAGPGSTQLLGENGAFRDNGRDPRASVNGFNAVTLGSELVFLTPKFWGFLDLRVGELLDPAAANASNRGSFTAALLNGSPGLDTNNLLR